MRAIIFSLFLWFYYCVYTCDAAWDTQKLNDTSNDELPTNHQPTKLPILCAVIFELEKLVYHNLFIDVFDSIFSS